MAKNSITDYDNTSGNNTDVQSVDISEGCSPSGINNAIREVMADLADVNDGTVALTSPQADSLTLNGNANFGDNDKAIFGAGSDLQIFHDGGNSWINDTGTGNLLIGGGNEVRITSPSAGEFMATFVNNGAATLYYDNSAKIATTSTGVDVSGTLATLPDTNGYALLAGRFSSGYPNATINSLNGVPWVIQQGGVERMRIDSSGNLMVGTTSSSPAGLSQAGKITTVAPSGNNGINVATIGAGTFMGFANSQFGQTGSISTSGTTTAYNTSSDYRLKENVTDITSATDRLKQLNPVRFNFIGDADTTVDGFLAHEVQTVVPEAITGTHNEVDDDGNPVYQGIDQSKLVPLLVATIQELEARIATLEAE